MCSGSEKGPYLRLIDFVWDIRFGHTFRWTKIERESLAAPGAFAGTAAVRYDVAAEAIAWANLLGNDLENVTFTGRQLRLRLKT